jgi:hypothetical protein
MTQDQLDRQFYSAIRSLNGLAAVVNKAIVIFLPFTT